MTWSIVKESDAPSSVRHRRLPPSPTCPFSRAVVVASKLLLQATGRSPCDGVSQWVVACLVRGSHDFECREATPSLDAFAECDHVRRDYILYLQGGQNCVRLIASRQTTYDLGLGWYLLGCIESLPPAADTSHLPPEQSTVRRFLYYLNNRHT